MIPKIIFEKTTILVVDDNPTNLGVVADYLEDHGFEIITARNGYSGLEKATFVIPDIILLDVMMPGIDGFETCQRLKADEKTRGIPIIFMTALASEEDKVKGFEVGATDYVTKPIQQREVLARVTTHLQIREQAKMLIRQAEELRELNASKDKFFSIVAHDLRGPFMPLLGNAELLAEMAETSPPNVVREISWNIYNSGKRVLDLLENLLQWSRMQMGHLEHDPTLFDFQGIAKENAELLSSAAEAKNITLSSQVDDNLMIYADGNMINTVVRNLTSNAIKFTSQNGTVTIMAESMGDIVEVSIRDSGVGISPEDINKLFQIDVQHSTIGTNKEQGTGLGLIMCKEMIVKNGGRIWIESALGKGTTVKFTIPIHE